MTALGHTSRVAPRVEEVAATQAPVVRTAIYARVSTADQDPGLQLDDLRRVAKQRGWLVVTEYVDAHTGAHKGPQRRQLMQNAHRGFFNLVAVWRFDRLARSPRDLLLAVDTCADLGINSLRVRETFDTSTPIGWATLTILVAVAELERNIIRDRVKADLDRVRRQDQLLGRPRRDVDVRRAMAMLEGGRSQRSVAMALKVPRSTLRRAIERELAKEES